VRRYLRYGARPGALARGLRTAAALIILGYVILLGWLWSRCEGWIMIF
jgi:hypothetical protein